MDNTPFERAVVYLIQHDAEGAMGVVINHSDNMKLGEIFRQLEISVNSPTLQNQAVLTGGPLQPHSGFVIHPPGGNWNSSVTMNPKIAVTSSKDILVAIASGKYLDSAVLALGYAGWSAGQLEAEIGRNDWLCTPASENIIFHTPMTERWEESMHLLGIKDIAQLSSWVGHA
ncbi:MAG: YqgE/AlgH family protein [Gammaproteobacteria bacterium]|nr:YqgE/AlgH family protein [Gammaproteobacteria bacterium]